MRPRTAIPALCLALLLPACEGDPEAAEPEAEVEVTLPSEAEVDAIDAEAEEKAADITAENADATLEELEKSIGGEEGDE